MLKFSNYSIELHSDERRAVKVYAKNNFPASFRQKKLKIWNFFETDVTFPIAFLNFYALFLQTHLQDSFNYCSSALATLQLTEAAIFGSGKFSAAEFLAKIIENPDTFQGKCYFFTIL